MASIVLGAVGSTVGGPVGGFVGAAVGGYIDQQFLFPTLFPQDAIQGPRLDDLQIAQNAEGSPLKWAIGPHNRFTGTLIWAPVGADNKILFTEVKRRQSRGGSGSQGQDTETYEYYVDVAFAIGDTGPQSFGRVMKVLGDVKTLWKRGTAETSPLFQEITFYDGTQTTPDPLIESYEGVGNVPAFKRTAYVVIKQLALAPFGNRILSPQFFVEQSADCSLRQAIEFILTRAGITAEQFDVSTLTQCVQGYTVSGRQSVAAVLQPLLQTYSLVIQDQGNKLVFLNRGRDPIAIAEEDVSPRVSPIRGISLTKRDKADLLGSSEIRYANIESELQQGAEIELNPLLRDGTSLTLAVPISFTPATAQGIARRLLYGSNIEEPCEFTLPPSYYYLLAGDNVSLTVDNKSYYVELQQLTYGVSGAIRCEGVVTSQSVYTQSGSTSPVNLTADEAPYIPPDVEPFLMDLPALTADQMNKIGLHFTGISDREDRDFIGARLYTSNDDVTYTERDDVLTRPTTGRIELTASARASSMFVDRGSRPIVRLDNSTDALTSISEDDMLGLTSNVAAVETTTGWEIICFRTATLVDVASNLWELSTILRGVRGTDQFIAEGFKQGGRFVMLQQDNSVNFWDAGPEQLGSTVFAKLPAFGGSLSNELAEQVTIGGATMRPLVVDGLEAVKSGDNYTFKWNSRSRSLVRSMQAVQQPWEPDESAGSLLVNIYRNGRFSPVLRSNELLWNTTEWSYSSADRLADRGSLAYSFGFEIRRVSSVYGPGPSTFMYVRQ